MANVSDLTQDEKNDVLIALETHIASMQRNTSYKDKPQAVRDLYAREALRFEAIRSKLMLTK